MSNGLFPSSAGRILRFFLNPTNPFVCVVFVRKHCLVRHYSPFFVYVPFFRRRLIVGGFVLETVGFFEFTVRKFVRMSYVRFPNTNA